MRMMGLGESPSSASTVASMSLMALAVHTLQAAARAQELGASSDAPKLQNWASSLPVPFAIGSHCMGNTGPLTSRSDR